MEAVAVYSEADAGAAHVRAADDAVLLGPASPAESYLRIDRVIDAARSTGADAVHPGYGFLAERAEFARAVEEAGIAFVGPSSRAISALGDKLAARRIAREVGVPVVPGTFDPAPVDRAEDVESILAQAREVGFPLLVKASAGRRWPRHAPRRAPGGPAGCARRRLTRGSVGLRRRFRLPRT